MFYTVIYNFYKVVAFARQVAIDNSVHMKLLQQWTLVSCSSLLQFHTYGVELSNKVGMIYIMQRNGH